MFFSGRKLKKKGREETSARGGIAPEVTVMLKHLSMSFCVDKAIFQCLACRNACKSLYIYALRFWSALCFIVDYLQIVILMSMPYMLMNVPQLEELIPNRFSGCSVPAIVF